MRLLLALAVALAFPAAALADPPTVKPDRAAINQLAMPLYGCLTPDGYKNTEDAWLSPDATTRRVSIATAFANT